MIGYYVHHHGRGHLHRALALASALAEPVTVLSSLDAPPGTTLPWVRLPRDDDATAVDGVTAGGRLHWVPLGDAGLRARMRRIADWLDDAQPRLLVVDVSVEVALLARLHGVPVLGVVQPGRRDDAAHLLGYDVCDALVALWPAGMTDLLLPGLPARVRDRVVPVGALSRAPVATSVLSPASPTPARVTVLMGAGGHAVDPAAVDRAVAATPAWSWTVLDGRPGSWVDDPAPALRDADVVVCHAGQNALAEVAAARRPAIVVPQDRPHDEQVVTAQAIAGGGWPVLVEERFPETGWPGRLAAVAALDGESWSGWCDGGAARRFADVVARSDRAVPTPA